LRKILIGSIAGVLLIVGIIGIVSVLKSGPSTQAQRLYKQSLKLIEAGRIEEAKANLARIITDFSNSDVTDEALLSLARLDVESGRWLEAKKKLQMAIALYPTADSIVEIQKLLWDVNIKILFSPLMTEDSISYEVKKGDTLYEIAKKFNTTVELIKKSNNIKNATIRPGDKLKIINTKFSVVVDKSKNTLTLKEEEEVLKVYPVSTGINNSTPVGTFKIVNKLIDPVWYKTGAIVAAESPDNILGSRWMGLSVKGYGIHGTTQPETIGKQITQGCIRMYNSDVEELYSILPMGTEVIIMD
jgi:lipoprotein-anchoring transpeptidase ErfK/SrfK